MSNRRRPLMTDEISDGYLNAILDVKDILTNKLNYDVYLRQADDAITERDKALAGVEKMYRSILFERSEAKRILSEVK